MISDDTFAALDREVTAARIELSAIDPFTTLPAAYVATSDVLADLEQLTRSLDRLRTLLTGDAPQGLTDDEFLALADKYAAIEEGGA